MPHMQTCASAWHFTGRVAGARYRQHARVDWLATGIPASSASLNLVLQRRTDGADVHERFHRVLAAAQVPGAPLYWLDGPAETPPGLRRLYQQHGLRANGEHWPMTLEIRRRHFPDEYPAGLQVTPVRVRAQIELFVRILAGEHPEQEATLQRWARLEASLGAGTCGCWERYLGVMDGQTVATAAIFYGGRTAGLYHLATTPEALAGASAAP